MITKNAYAKVNLSLDIVGRRDDGYHLVRMVMQSLDIKDILTFTKTEVSNSEDRIKIELVQSEDSKKESFKNKSKKEEKDELGVVPLGKDNLIYKVAELLLSKYVWPEAPNSGVKITLEKHIPIAAGMAGGSSDAAATFKGISDLFDLGIMDQDLMEMAVPLGADIPYCIMGGTALSEGIGEVLTKLPAIPDCFFLVAKPTISVSTAEFLIASSLWQSQLYLFQQLKHMVDTTSWQKASNQEQRKESSIRMWMVRLMQSIRDHSEVLPIDLQMFLNT